MRKDGGPTDEPRFVLREALSQTDDRGRFRTEDVPAVREAVIQALSEDRVPDHPAQLFGRWAELGPRATGALRRAAQADIVRAMDYYPHGWLWTRLVRTSWELDRFLAGRRWARRLRGWVVFAAVRFARGPHRVRERLGRLLDRACWRIGRGVTVEALLSRLGRTPQWLLADFAEGVPVDARARGFHVDAGRNTLYGYHVGLDLMLTPDGEVICLEANLEPGIKDGHRELLPGNPIVEGVVATALRHGAKRLVWIEANRFPLHAWMLEDLHAEAARAGLAVEVLEDPCMPSRDRRELRSAPPPRWPYELSTPPDTFVFRRNGFQVGSDYVISNKELFARALASELESDVDPPIRVLPMTRTPGEVRLPSEPGLPNLVYKFPDSFAGQGVFFLRARSEAHAIQLARTLDRRHGEREGLFQPFRRSRLLDGRRIFDVRAEILITPLGTTFLLALRRESAQPLPTRLEEGVSGLSGVFTANLSTGGSFSLPSTEEASILRAASLAIGEAMRRMLGRTFLTESGSSHDG